LLYAGSSASSKRKIYDAVLEDLMPTESYRQVVADFGPACRTFEARFQPDHVGTHQPRELNDFQNGLLRASERLLARPEK
jgi:hypothetical protein